MKNFSSILFWLVTLAITQQSCSSKSGTEPKSFCYWDTTYKVDTTSYQQYVVNHMYIRYFDVDWDEASQTALPVATLRTRGVLIGDYTPTVFLTNRVFEKSSEADLSLLAERIAERIKAVDSEFKYIESYSADIAWDDTLATKSMEERFQSRSKSILIDCDWTEGTRDKFFSFLDQIKKTIPQKEIETTLRLWQYKYRQKAGVPPVNRCLLMCYNMQMANDYNAVNSIASLEELKKYVVGEKYPLPLDIALPVFSWAVLFRDQRSAGIISNTDSRTLHAKIDKFKRISDNRFEVLQDQVLGQTYIRKGDEIRTETVSGRDLQDIARYLAKQVGKDSTRRVTFFAWNKYNLENYKDYELDKAVSSLTR